MKYSAIHGTDKPVYHGGKLIGKVKDYSDTLLMFLLKAKRPETYKDRADSARKDNEPTDYDITLKI
ncbi:hypothetical protein BC343_16705 [Mucilaginibacter pedocola]|uniref:Uncharacterized protein n=1 Tax=Mucilaginibacter pedocola TaxID=1792845 RepID=A0A1S9P871_9SPHI|nr:hypothetical protein BC343_16705 [Mucilaginibacter pedocola]